MGTFEVDVNAMVTVHESEHFTICADSVEDAEEKAKKLFEMRMWEKHGYADYNEVEVVHYPENWRNGL